MKKDIFQYTGQNREETTEFNLDFTKIKELMQIEQDVLPVIVQHADTREVLLLAYTNKEALEKSLAQKRVIFWSTSRDILWVKGATSGDYLELIDVRTNCEQNSLLYSVVPITGKVCHTRNSEGENRSTCFYRRLLLGKNQPNTLEFTEK